MFRPLSFAAVFLPLPALAATATVPLDVSLTVHESCRIERDDGHAAPPLVSCALGSPYRVRTSAAEQAGGPRAAPQAVQRLAPGRWEVVF